MDSVGINDFVGAEFIVVSIRKQFSSLHYSKLEMIRVQKVVDSCRRNRHIPLWMRCKRRFCHFLSAIYVKDGTSQAVLLTSLSWISNVFSVEK